MKSFIYNKIWLVPCILLLTQCTKSPLQSVNIGGAKDGLSGATFDPNIPNHGTPIGEVFNPNLGSDGAGEGADNKKITVSYKTLGSQLTDGMLREWRDSHGSTVQSQDKPYIKYIYIDQEFISDTWKLNKARVALFKALNHVAIGNTEIKLGVDVSKGHGLMWAIDTRDFFGNRAQEKWGIMANLVTPSRLSRSGEAMITAPDFNRNQRFNVDATLSASRMVYSLVTPDNYTQLIDTPDYESQLRQQLGFANRSCTALASQKDAIVYGARIACLRYTSDGRIYWNTADDFFGREGAALPYVEFSVRDNTGRTSYAPQFRGDGMLNFPGASTIASEAWVGMKNGFNAYYIWGNANQKRGRAEAFVDDPDGVGYGNFNPNVTSFQGHYLETGRSCITCHAQGPQSKPSDMATAMAGSNGQALAAAKQYWSTNEELNVYYEESRLLFQKAMTTIVDNISDASDSENEKLKNGADGEPILMMVKVIDRTAR